MRELNELKDAKDRAKKTRERAAKVIKHFGEVFNEGLVASGRPGVEIHFEPDEPEGEIFTANNLNHQFGDDCHLASVLKRQIDHADEHVLLVTQDIGVQLKARAKGISFVDAPAQHRLPVGPDSLEKRNQQLEQELASYKAQIPSIRVCADDGTRQINITKYAHSGEDSQPDVRAELARRTIRLDLQIINDGKVPATDVDVILLLPNGLRALDEKMLRDYWETPEDADLKEILTRSLRKKSGQYGETGSNYILQELTYWQFQALIATARPKPDISISEPIKPALENHRVKYHIKKLKHSLPYLLESLYIVFDTVESVGPFNIDFTVTGHELPVNETGKISVVAKLEHGDVSKD